MENNLLEELAKVHGKVFEAMLPSKDKIIIREQNGEDDDILSNLADFKSGESVHNFLAGVIIWHSRYGKVVTPEMIKKMPQRDKYISLILTRIFSYGDELHFKWQWEDSKKPDEYTEDLNIYIWDYTKPLPKTSDKEYSKFRIEPYTDDPYQKIEATLQSGKHVRMSYING